MKRRKHHLNVKNTAISLIIASFLLMGSMFSSYPAKKGVAKGIEKENIKRVIVQMEETPAIKIAGNRNLSSSQQLLEVKKKSSELKKEHEKVIERISEIGIALDEAYDYTVAFNGIALEVPSNQIDALQSLPGVKAVYPDQQYHSSLVDSVKTIGAPDVWEMNDQNNQWVTGKGVNIALLDSGVDYTHPDLGGTFGPGHKVAAGYDFVNKKNDPMDDLGHGTHVAGIIAANGQLKGVAPDATIVAYKVTNKNGDGNLSDILAAIDEAISPSNPYRADVINMSLTGPGDGKDLLSQAAQNAVDAGVVVVASAGNTGPGYGTVGSPAIADGVIAVGASTSGVKIPFAKMIAPVTKNLTIKRRNYTANPPVGEDVADLVDLGAGLAADYTGKDVTGKIVLIESDSKDLDKAMMAQEKGAIAAFFQTTSSAPMFAFQGIVPAQYGTDAEQASEKQNEYVVGASIDSRLDKLVAMEIDNNTGALLKSNLANGPVSISLSSVDATDQIADFSSRGTSPNFKMKPDIVAPGVEILSTFPKSKLASGYYRMNGTSMAAPHVTGAAALLKQLHPTWNASEISGALTGTSKKLESYDTLTQGAGRLDVKAAANAAVVASPKGISFGLADIATKNIQDRSSFTLTNLGNKAVDVDLSTQSDGKTAHSIEVTPSQVHIGPGEKVKVTVNLSMVRPEKDSEVTGWIKGKVSGIDSPQDFQVPYHLSVKLLQVFSTPDPAVTQSEAFIYVPTNYIQAPVVKLTSPTGKETQISAVFDHDKWWRAPFNVGKAGIYQIEVTALAEGDSEKPTVTLKGFSELEVTSPNQNGDEKWLPVGPNADGGQLAFDPHDPKKIMAVDRVAPGVYLSDNNAETWKELRGFPIGGGIPVGMVVDPHDGNNIYLAINGEKSDPTYVGKIVTTKDQGKTWTSLPFPNERIYSINIDQTGRMLIATTDNSAYYSLDKGMNWDKVAGPWTKVNDTQLIGSDLYLATSKGVYVVRNIFSGVGTPELVYDPPFPSKSIRNVVGNENFIIANTYYYNGMFISYDKGKEWESIPNLPFSSANTLIYTDGKLFASPLSGKSWVSDDLGKTWKPWNKPIEGSIDIDFSKNPKKPNSYYVSSEQAGIFKTLDSGQTYKRVGVPGAIVYDLAVSRDAEGGKLIAGTQFEIYKTSFPTSRKVDASTLEWGLSGGEGMVGVQVFQIETSPADPSIVFKVKKDAFGNLRIYKSTDGGVTWKSKYSEERNPVSLFIHPANPNLIYLFYTSITENGLLVSRDGGETWGKIINGLRIVTMAGDPANPNRMWVGTDKGLFVSNDAGETLEKQQDVPVSKIVVSHEDPNKLVIGGREFFYSTDGGRTLQEAAFEKLSLYVNDILFSPTDSNTLYAATGSFYEAGLIKGGRGVLRSIDGGKSWHSYSNGLQNRAAIALALSLDGKYLYVGTNGGSVHRIPADQSNCSNKRKTCYR